MSDLVERLRALSRNEHSDHSLGDEAAGRIEELESELAALVEALQEARVELESCWLNHYGENPEGSPIPPHIQKAAEAVVAYGERGKALLAVVEAARKVSDLPLRGWEASVDARDTLAKALAALDATAEKS